MKASGTPSDNRTTINLISGTILNEITSPLSANSVYEVNTPKATMAVRGTSFTVTVTQLDDGTYITDLNTFHGNVAVQLIDKNGGNKGEEVSVAPGMAVTIKTDYGDEADDIDLLEKGNSFFVVKAADAPDDAPDEEKYIPVEEGEDPVYESDYAVLYEITVPRGGIVGLLPDVPEKEGYSVVLVVKGTDVSAGEVTSSTIVTSDMTIEPIYVVKDIVVTITYPVSGGNVTIERTVKYGDPIGALIEAPEGRYYLWTDEYGQTKTARK